MDSVDMKILREVVLDARASNRELALRVGLSEAQCSRRLRALRESGVIVRFTAVLDPTLVDLSLEMLVVFSLTSTDAKTTESFESAVSVIAPMIQLSRIVGIADYYALLHAKDSTGVDRLLAVFSQLPGVRRFDVSLVTRTIRRSSGPNLQ